MRKFSFEVILLVIRCSEYKKKQKSVRPIMPAYIPTPMLIRPILRSFARSGSNASIVFVTWKKYIEQIMVVEKAWRAVRPRKAKKYLRLRLPMHVPIQGQ